MLLVAAQPFHQASLSLNLQNYFQFSFPSISDI